MLGRRGRRAGGEGGVSCGREVPRHRRRRRRQPERKFPWRARPRRADVAVARGEGSSSCASSLPSRCAHWAARAWLTGKQGSIAVGLLAPNLEGEDAANASGSAGRGGALSAPRGRPGARQPGLRPGERAEAEWLGSGSSAGTAPAARTRAASATVPASPPRHGAMVRGARTLRAGL